MEGEDRLMYVGLYVHKKICFGTVLDGGGEVVRQGRFDNDFEDLCRFMEDLEAAMVVMEAGYCWQPLYDALEEAGHDVKLAHPKEVKALSKKKTDKVDSESLRSYAGVVPVVWRSGGTTHHGGITKEGSGWLRWALTQAVYAHLRHETNLTRFYRKLAAKKPIQVAVMATARKMLKVIYWMLRNDEPFHPGPGVVDPVRRG
jgi:transposase